MKVFKVAFLGGSVFACGGALLYGEDAVVLERNIVLGSEFTLTFGKTKLSKAVSQIGASFYDELMQRGLAHDGLVHLPPVSDVLAEWMRKKNCQVYLNCEVINVHKKEGIYEITFWSCAGVQTIYAEHIVDTTERGFRNVGDDYIAAQYLCGALKGMAHKLGKSEAYDFVKGPLEEENVFVCKIPKLMDYRFARQVFYNIWKEIHEKHPELYLLSEGQKMIYEYTGSIQLEIEEYYRWIPSGQYEDIMRAFEEGLVCSI